MKVRQSDADKDSLQKVSWWAVVRVRPLAVFLLWTSLHMGPVGGVTGAADIKPSKSPARVRSGQDMGKSRMNDDSNF